MNKIFIVFLTSFMLGVFFGYYAIAFFQVPSGSPLIVGGSQKLDMQQFWKVLDVLENKYYSEDTIDKQDLQYGAIEGLVDALGDKHSEFLNPEDTERFELALSGDFEGIGAVVEKVPLGVLVERIFKGSPAKNNDIRPGDIIISANGTELQEYDIWDAVEYIKGPAGTTVNLEILRSGEKGAITKEVVRGKITIPSVESEYFEKEDLSYISINIYGEDTAREFRSALNKSKESAGLIIDLRDNGGGYLNIATQILSEFIDSGDLLVTTRYKNSFLDQKFYSDNFGGVYDKKIVVLINESSASASEITAGALSEHGKAIVVGKKSYGKGSVQQPFEMKDGSLLKLTVAKWFTPNNKNIDDEGITPDIDITIENEDYENNYDRQLETAKQILLDFIASESLGDTIEKYNISDTE